MAELSSDTNILRLRLNQFLRKKLIYSGNFQAGFKCYKGRVCSWHTWIVDLFSKIKNKYTSAKLWPTPYSYLKTQENGLPTDCRCLLSRCMFCQHFSTNFWSISLVSKAMLYGEMKRGLYNEAKSLIYIMKIFWEKKIKTRKTCFQNRDCYLQNKWRSLWSPSTTGTQQDSETDLFQNSSVQRHRHAQSMAGSKSWRWVKGGILFQKILYYMRLSSPS